MIYEFEIANLSEYSRRDLWLGFLEKLTKPVFLNLAEEKLKTNFPNSEFFQNFSYLEAFGRSLSGIAYWLNQSHGDPRERELRRHLIELILKSIENGTNPNSPDFFDFVTERQPLVDTAYFAKALLQATPVLWDPLPNHVKQNVFNALQNVLIFRPWANNFVLFNSMIEIALWKLGAEVDFSHTEFALRKIEQWYLGDGIYGDGPEFHFDYYNSITIQPFLLTILDHINQGSDVFQATAKRVRRIAMRYANIQERMIAPDGTYPVLGRSITYRLGVFHHLAEMAYRTALPDDLAPSQVREALTSVLIRVLRTEIFDEQGWLKIGLAGHQPRLGENYISHGSLYMTSAVLPILGLSQQDDFWSGPNLPWSSVKVWSGGDVIRDHALEMK